IPYEGSGIPQSGHVRRRACQIISYKAMSPRWAAIAPNRCCRFQQGGPVKDGIAIEMRDVVKRFGEVVAVDPVNTRIRDGEFFSMLGPSGCGKTTSLRMIAGFEYPSAGEISLNGQSIGHTPPFQRNVNTVFQSYALFPHMTVAENVAFGLQMKQVPK